MTPPRSKMKLINIIFAGLLFVAMAGAVFFMIKYDQANRKEEIIYTEDKKTDNGNGLALPGLAKSDAQALAAPGSSSGSTSSSFSTIPGTNSATSSSASSGQSAPQPVRSQTLDNGLKIEEYAIGQGDRATKVGDTIAAHYIGYLTNGTVFDTSLKGEKRPFAFKLGAGQVIKGWDIGLQDMKVGAVRRLYIPAALAYGAQATGSIPANSPLIFDVQLMGIQ